MRQIAIYILAVVLAVSAAAFDAAASSPVAEVTSLTVAPDALAPGQEPVITAVISRTRAAVPQEPAAFNIITVVTLPNNITRSSMRQGELFERGQSRQFAVPRFFDTKLTGTYKIEFHVYSRDMRSRIATGSRTFSVAVGAAQKPAPLQSAPAMKKEPSRQPETGRPVFGLGGYGNALNPAGGGTVFLWPFEHVGIQGIYTAGRFTTAEGRMLVKFGDVGGVRPYLGAGYVSVSKTADVIGVSTRFRDSGISGVIGAEVPISRRWYGYLEVSGSSIKLKEIVTSGVQTVEAKVVYAPVTIGVGIVLYLF